MDYLPLNGRQFPRFSGIKTFFRLPNVEIEQDYEVALCGVPFDGGVSYRPGGRFAPTKVRELSSLGRGYHWQRGQNFFELLKVADIGDCPTNPINLKSSHQIIEDFFQKLTALNKKFISVGGDHSTTLPILRALKKKYGKLNLIHFDAHLDTYPAAWGEEYHHGTFVRHAVEEQLINPKTSYQIGIRGPLASEHDLDFQKKHQLNILTMDDLRSLHLNEVLKRSFQFTVHGPTYISFDVDCMDPAFAPGTGTPVPGGLNSYEVQQILRHLKIENLVGADIVEICPPYDHGDITSLMGVDIMFELLHLYAKK